MMQRAIYPMIELTFNPFSLLISVALIISLTLGFLVLFSRDKNRKAKYFLAALMFIIAFWNASILSLDLNIYRYALGIIWVPMTYTLALGPCFYFYVHYTTDTKYQQNPTIWFHFIPVALEVMLFLIEVFQGLPQGIGYFETSIFKTFDPLINGLAILSFVIYGFFARQKIREYHEWVKSNYSHFHRYNLNWLYRLNSAFLILLAFWLFYFLSDYFLFDYKLSFYDYYPFHLTLAIISIWLGIEAMSRSNILFPEVISNSKISHESTEPSESAEVDIVEKANWLKQQIEDNYLYLDPELSLRSLAETLDIHPNLTSKIINEGLKQSFSDCINQYRINAVLEKLESPDTQDSTFLAIAFNCGFNSKATFNRVFKKTVGQTPLQYKNNLKKS